MRYDALGPYIVWINYGGVCWAPRSFDTIREAVTSQETGYAENVITKTVKFEIKEIETDGDQGDQGEGKKEAGAGRGEEGRTVD